MIEITAAEAILGLDALIQDVAQSHEPVCILGGQANAVLVSREDWDAAQETMHLCSVPGMRESIRDGLATPCSQLEEGLDW
jgi:PHD/YefM family antitoxin component YafN of YafNO toxin-antitoxin module